MEIRFYIDPDTDLPHIYGHGVTESEVAEVLSHPLENRSGSEGSRVLIGRTRAGRVLRVIVSFHDDGDGVFVITAFEIRGKPLTALRRRLKRRGRL